jgi:hypothetical protein
MAAWKTSSDLNSAALEVLSQLPAEIPALSPAGTAVPMRIVGWDTGAISAQVPVDTVEADDALQVRIRDDFGSGHDITLRVRDVFFYSSGLLLTKLETEEIDEILGERAHGRAPIHSLAHMRVVESAALVGGFEFEVHLSDLSEGGVGFVTAHRLQQGDLLSLVADVENSELQMVIRVMHETPGLYGRRRFGGEIVGAADDVRAQLEQFTADTGEQPGSSSQRYVA